MNRPLFLVPLFVSLLTLALPTLAPAQGDPAALRQQYWEALARGDVAGALALYADEAVIDGGGLCTAAPCLGKAAIQKEFERRVAGQYRTTTLSNYVSGNVVTTRFEVRNDVLPKAGVERAMAWEIIEVKGDKIASSRLLLERTDPQTARLVEWQRAQPPTR
jgi:hypothetical protein